MNATDPAASTNRCQYRTPSGRQCTAAATDANAAFCPRHTVAPPNDSTDFSGHLIREGDHFQSARQINESLIALYELLAAGHISPRRASVLAYIAHLMLTTHKAIDYDDRWHKRRLSSLPQGPGEPRYNQPPGPGKEPLPDTAEEFIDTALKRKPS